MLLNQGSSLHDPGILHKADILHSLNNPVRKKYEDQVRHAEQAG